MAWSKKIWFNFLEKKTSLRVARLPMCSCIWMYGWFIKNSENTWAIENFKTLVSVWDYKPEIMFISPYPRLNSRPNLSFTYSRTFEVDNFGPSSIRLVWWGDDWFSALWEVWQVTQMSDWAEKRSKEVACMGGHDVDSDFYGTVCATFMMWSG